MTTTKPTFQEWFGLKENRRNFQIDPLRDQAFLFGKPEWEEEINSRLKRAQPASARRSVLRVWWSGHRAKTYRLRHTG